MRAGTSEPEYAESIGDSLDIAIRQAVDILGAREDEVDVEVLQEGRRGFLWFSPKRPYRVRVTWRADQTHEEIVGAAPSEETPAPSFPAGAEAGVARGHGRERGAGRDRGTGRDERPRRDEGRAGRRDEHGEVQSEVRRESRLEGRREARGEERRETRGEERRESRGDERRETRGDERREPRRESRWDERRETRSPESREVTREERVEPARAGSREDSQEPRTTESLAEAERFVSGVFSRMQLGADLSARDAQDGVRLRVSGEEAESFLAERDGEVQSALQVLTHRVLSRQAERSVPVVIELGESGPAHDSDLHALALRLAEEVVATSQSTETEPLSSPDRRIIHRALADHPSVVTESQGRGLLKRVRISPR